MFLITFRESKKRQSESFDPSFLSALGTLKTELRSSRCTDIIVFDPTCEHRSVLSIRYIDAERYATGLESFVIVTRGLVIKSRPGSMMNEHASRADFSHELEDGSWLELATENYSRYIFSLARSNVGRICQNNP